MKTIKQIEQQQQKAVDDIAEILFLNNFTPKESTNVIIRSMIKVFSKISENPNTDIWNASNQMLMYSQAMTKAELEKD